MLSHDPLCPNQPEYHDGSILWPARCDCDLIARVREDERMIRQEEKRISYMEGMERSHHDPGTRCDGCHSFGYDDGYAAALRDAVEAVKALPDTGGWTTPDGVIHEVDRAKAVAAIEALQ